MAGRVFLEYAKLHLKTAMEYRVNFFAQAGFMALNNSVWIVIWYVLFAGLGEINGYGFAEVTVLFGIAALVIGFSRALFGKTEYIGENIAEGKIDVFLSMPVDELFHMMISQSQPDAFGDIFFGVLILVIFAPQHVLLGVAVALLGMVVFLSFAITIQTIAFYLERPFKLMRSLLMGAFAFSTWPIDVFDYGVRVWLYAIPVAFIAMVPYHVMTSFSIIWLGYLAAVAFTLLLLAVLAFKYGVHRYESGNLVVQRG